VLTPLKSAPEQAVALPEKIWSAKHPMLGFFSKKRRHAAMLDEARRFLAFYPDQDVSGVPLEFRRFVKDALNHLFAH
jgi:hypothetical protein